MTPRRRLNDEGCLDRFRQGVKRTAQLRSLGWAAYAAAREVGDPVATAAARGAELVIAD
jgi:hypothetical protein